MLKFDLPKNQSSIIKVIGVGGGGSNAVSHMYQQGIEGVDFIICNTDNQALESSSIPTKIQLGSTGLGAGSIPDVGRESAEETIEGLKNLLEKNSKMLFITAGMGGGTGTGAAPVIAKTAQEMGILTIGIVTIPFSFEGRKRKIQADAGIEELRKHVDSLLIICNDKLREVHGDLKLSQAFEKADNILTVAAKGIAEIITVTGYINVDFEDVKTVMKNSGTALMGSAVAEGENRAQAAVQEALASPLLNDNHIKGTNNILLYLASGDEELTMDEVTEITDYIQKEAGEDAEIIWGNGTDYSLGNKISITLVATGFNSDITGYGFKPAQRKVHELKVGPKEIQEKPKSRVTGPITEITLIKPESEKEKPVEPTSEIKKPEEKKKEEIKAVEFKIENSSGISEIKIKPTNKLKPEEKESSIKDEPTRIGAGREFGFKDTIERDEIEKKSRERVQKLKDLSLKLRSSQEVDHMENVPAYIRRNVELSDVKPSDESEISRLSLGDGDSKGNLKSNNSFLHDNVD